MISRKGRAWEHSRDLNTRPKTLLGSLRLKGSPKANGRSWANHAATRGEWLLQSASEQLQRRG